jgi:hypothetical protein
MVVTLILWTIVVLWERSRLRRRRSAHRVAHAGT